MPFAVSYTYTRTDASTHAHTHSQHTPQFIVLGVDLQEHLKDEEEEAFQRAIKGRGHSAEYEQHATSFF